MGCIVNGPGEMGDSDFGLIGSQKDKVNLYVKDNLIEKNVDEKEAVTKLKFLIETFCKNS